MLRGGVMFRGLPRCGQHWAARWYSGAPFKPPPPLSFRAKPQAKPLGQSILNKLAPQSQPSSTPPQSKPAPHTVPEKLRFPSLFAGHMAGKLPGTKPPPSPIAFLLPNPSVPSKPAATASLAPPQPVVAPTEAAAVEQDIPGDASTKRKKKKKQKALTAEADKYWSSLASKTPAQEGEGAVASASSGDAPPKASPTLPNGPEPVLPASTSSTAGQAPATDAAKPPSASTAEAEPAASAASPATPEEKTLVARPPVVTIMGHVDHGKTTILDKLRNAHVAQGEVGGITQSIGAFSVQLPEGTVTFVDTPGHEAFKEMRQAGALVTDIIVVVIAASEGIMPQTREVLELAQWQHLPIIIALNKIDLGTNLVDRILRELHTDCGLDLETFGGNTQVVKLSAIRGEGLQDLVQAILLEAALAELRAEVNCTAEGVVLESRKDARQGATVSIIVRKGHIDVGDWVVAGTQCHRIRGLRDDKGLPVTTAAPSCAVELLGLKALLPEPCSKLLVLRDERQARRMAKERSELAKEDSREQFYEEVEKMRLQRQKEGKRTPKKVLNAYGSVDLKAKYQEKFLHRNRDVTPKATIPTFDVILKADVAGTLKALVKMVSELDAGHRVAVEVVKSGVGPVTEQELELARVAHASIVAFNVDHLRAPKGESEPKVHHFDLIYHAIDFIKQGMAEAIEPVEVTNVLGVADVKQIFVLNGKRSNGRPPVVAGCHVHTGTIQKGRDVQCRVLRHTKVVHVGQIQSLKVHQNEAGKVAHGSDCGILLEGDFEPEVGDVIQTINVEKRHCTIAEVFGSG
eukprot:GGOE01001053.1.p1 GENE.GGOE01001053.1~~GGOE01001053.1.p1  ORF type:complete len:801 (+),score=261.42 GGOE01001053.1:49-2451(+)